MISSLFFIIISVIYNVILSIVFYNKIHVKSKEIKIYGHLLIVNLIGLFLELYNLFSIRFFGPEKVVTTIASKLYLCYFIVYSLLFFKYFFAISFSSSKLKRYMKYFNIFSFIVFAASVALIVYLPVEYNTKNNIYMYGVAVNAVYSITSIVLILIILTYTIRYKHIEKSKFISCLAFILGSSFVVLIQKYFPFITLSTAIQTVVLFIMYITIENPDVKMLQKVKLAKLLVERANQNKNEYLNNVSHEIRTPLNSIIGFSEDIKSYNTSKEVEEDANYILEASNNLIDVVDNIVDMNKDETTKLEVELKPYNFKKEINWVIQNQINSIQDRDIKIQVSMDENIPNKIMGDKVYVKEIINNLLCNSISIVEKGLIELSIQSTISENNCTLAIVIRDNGKKYKKDEINEFNNLYVDDNFDINEGNLFLAITKNLVNMMDGKINIESNSKSGNTVTVVLPQQLCQNNVEEYNVVNDNMNYMNKKVLVVDDNDLNIKVLKRALNGLNMIIDDASSGVEAIEKINSGNIYDVILMDIMMPKLSGSETLKKLKENPAFVTPVIALTADASRNAKSKYLKDGFVDYMPKPYNKKQIKEKLDSVFKK